MTKNTAMPIVMTDEELLAGIEKSLRNQRLKAAIRSRLLSQREKLLKKMGRGQATEQQQDSRFAEFTAAQQRVLNRMTGNELEIWEHVYRIENERRAQPKQGSPVLDLEVQTVKPTASEVEALFNGGVKRTVQAARAFAPGPQADID